MPATYTLMLADNLDAKVRAKIEAIRAADEEVAANPKVLFAMLKGLGSMKAHIDGGLIALNKSGSDRVGVIERAVAWVKNNSGSFADLLARRKGVWADLNEVATFELDLTNPAYAPKVVEVTTKGADGKEVKSMKLRIDVPQEALPQGAITLLTAARGIDEEIRSQVATRLKEAGVIKGDTLSGARIEIGEAVEVIAREKKAAAKRDPNAPKAARNTGFEYVVTYGESKTPVGIFTKAAAVVNGCAKYGLEHGIMKVTNEGPRPFTQNEATGSSFNLPTIYQPVLERSGFQIEKRPLAKAAPAPAATPAPAEAVTETPAV